MKCPSITVTSHTEPQSANAPGLNIPWAALDEWSAVNDTLRFFTRTRRHRLHQLFELAAAITSKMQQLHALAAELAMATCRFCPAPCCQTAAPWFDFNDLLRIHCCGLPIPPGQPISRYGDVCRYVGPSGCLLPRQQRPWICAWYACPVQRGAIHRSPDRYTDYTSTTNDLQKRRSLLEQAFIDGTTGAGIP